MRPSVKKELKGEAEREGREKSTVSWRGEMIQKIRGAGGITSKGLTSTTGQRSAGCVCLGIKGGEGGSKLASLDEEKVARW